MTGRTCVRMFVGLVVGVFSGTAYGDELTIYQIQWNTSNGDASIYHQQIHNVAGGVVTYVWHRAGDSNERVYLQDPAHPTWGAIVVKDAHLGELSNNVNVGDWVSFDNIYIEEYRGTTFLQYRDNPEPPNPTFTIESTGNSVPAPTVLTAADLVVPVNHAASEPYESMVVKLRNVVVGQKGLGKASDNYELLQENDTAWGTDYMNVDAGAPYDPRIVTGRMLAHITGVVEQYTYQAWDYYQLNTRGAEDIVDAVPAVSEWGMAVFALLTVIAGTVVLRRAAA